jgi:hypothetical protein
MLVSTSPLSRSERCVRRRTTACANERLRLDWHSPAVTSVKPGSGSTLLPSGRVVARACPLGVLALGADRQFGVGASDQLSRAVLCLKRCKSNLISHGSESAPSAAWMTLSSLARESSAGQR